MEMPHPFKIAAIAYAFFFSICVMIYIDMLSHKNWQTIRKSWKKKDLTTGEQFSQVQQAMIEEEKWAAPSMTYFRPHFMVSIMMIVVIIVIVIIRLANFRRQEFKSGPCLLCYLTDIFF